MTDLEALEQFRACGAILEGHFKLSSGLHSNRYLQCARVLMYPEIAAKLCRALRQRYDGEMPDLVIGPAMGAVTLGYEVARAFGTPGIFVERENGEFAVRRGFTIEPGQKVLLAEDVVTTGGSIKEVQQLVESHGATVVGVVSLVQRAKENPFDVPLTALMPLKVDAFEPSECPRCAEGDEAMKPGSRPD